jgi:hypothetical protein
VEALAARGLHEALKPALFEPAAHIEGRLDHRGPRHALAGIEIEDQPVRSFQLGDRRSPGMHFEDTCLNEIDKPIAAVEAEHLLLLADIDAPHRAGEAMPVVLGEETLLAYSRRTAHEAQDPPADVGKNPIGNVRIEIRESLLGDAWLRPEDSFRMGERTPVPRRFTSALAGE